MMRIRLQLVVLATALVASPSVARNGDDAKVMPNGEKIICQSVEETGSLVRRTKRCYTRAQWDRIADAARANGQRITSNHASGITTN